MASGDATANEGATIDRGEVIKRFFSVRCTKKKRMPQVVGATRTSNSLAFANLLANTSRYHGTVVLTISTLCRLLQVVSNLN